MGIRKPAYDRKNQCRCNLNNIQHLESRKILKKELIKKLLYFTVPVSQVQVAAAASAVTGAPLHVATPMAQYLSHYPQAHPQTFQTPYAHMV